MISLKLAKQLKNAGLVWKPKRMDEIWHKLKKEKGTVLAGAPKWVNLHIHWQNGGFGNSHKNLCVFLPRLDQLLAEIGVRGYWWKLETGTCLITDQEYGLTKCFLADITEDAVAKALLWILEQKV